MQGPYTLNLRGSVKALGIQGWGLCLVHVQNPEPSHVDQ